MPLGLFLLSYFIPNCILRLKLLFLVFLGSTKYGRQMCFSRAYGEIHQRK